MRILLDTHAFLWWANDDPRLSRSASELMSSPDNQPLLSVVSAWEIAIKVSTGKMKIDGTMEKWLGEEMKYSRISSLDVTMPHAVRVAALPRHHRDPFDRLLIAQAQVEGLRIVTADKQIRRYDVPTIW